MNSKKLYDKISKGLKKGVIATGLTALVLSPSGCAFTTNIKSGLETPQVTQKSAKYNLEGFTSEGIGYQIINSRTYKVGDETYDVPAIVKINESREVIDPENRAVEVRSNHYYPIVPVRFDTEANRLYVADPTDKTREKFEVLGISVDKINVKDGFSIIKRNSNGTGYSLDGMNLKESGNYFFNRNDTEIYLGENTTRTLYQENNPKNPNHSQEVLPMILLKKDGHRRIIDRGKGKFFLEGEVYKPIIGNLVKEPIVIEVKEKESEIVVKPSLEAGKIESADDEEILK